MVTCRHLDYLWLSMIVLLTIRQQPELGIITHFSSLVQVSLFPLVAPGPLWAPGQQ
jgi:hypothetical protein